MQRSALTGERVSTLAYLPHLMVQHQAGHPDAFKLLTEYLANVRDDSGCPQLAKQAKYRSALSCCRTVFALGVIQAMLVIRLRVQDNSMTRYAETLFLLQERQQQLDIATCSCS